MNSTVIVHVQCDPLVCTLLEEAGIERSFIYMCSEMRSGQTFP